MQKALIIQSCDLNNYDVPLDAAELNSHLAQGWRFVSAAPVGCSVSEGGETSAGSSFAAILVIIEKSEG